MALFNVEKSVSKDKQNDVLVSGDISLSAQIKKKIKRHFVRSGI